MFVQKVHLARTLAALTLALTALPLCAAGSKDFQDSVGAAWIKATRANDLNALAALYADDAVAWFPDENEHRGRAAIRESYKNLLYPFTVIDASLTDGHHLGDANHRTNWGHFSMTLKQKSDGKTITMSGRYTDVQEKRHGKWVYVADHASAEPAPKATP